MAKTKDIDGRSTMTKQELVAALAQCPNRVFARAECDVGPSVLLGVYFAVGL